MVEREIMQNPSTQAFFSSLGKTGKVEDHLREMLRQHGPFQARATQSVGLGRFWLSIHSDTSYEMGSRHFETFVAIWQTITIDWIFVFPLLPPKSYVETLLHSVNNIWRRGVWEVIRISRDYEGREPMNGISAFIRVRRELASSLLSRMWRSHEELAVCTM